MTETVVQNFFGQEPLIQKTTWYKALTLQERLASLRAQETLSLSAYDEQLAARKLQKWRQQKPFDQDTLFAEYLTLNTLTEHELLVLLGETVTAMRDRTHNRPDWLQELVAAFDNLDPAQAEIMNTFIRQIHSSVQSQDEPSSTARQTLLLVAATPFILHGVKHLKAGIAQLASSGSYLPFDPTTIHQALLASLPEQVLHQILRVMTLELNVARVEERLQGATPDERFLDFVRLMSQQEHILSLYEEYVSLARILTTTVRHWVNYQIEFLQHLCADWDDIRQALLPTDTPGQLVEIIGGIGDRHKKGRSTLKLRFSSGTYLVYKPKPMLIDIHFQELLAWLNERGDHPPFRLLKVLDKGRYGWSEYISNCECKTEEEIARFYERQGGYLALLYALEATDVHCENLIAAGEQPIMIDLEALFHPRVEQYALAQTQKMALETMNYSVLRVGLLPMRIWGTMEREGIDISGLSGKGGQTMPQMALALDAIGTDEMRLVRQYFQTNEKQNRPLLNGTPVEVVAYAEHVLSGFTRIYHTLMHYREELLAGPIAHFAQDEIRLIVRPTKVYAQLLNESYHPDLLRDALDREQFFNRIWTGIEMQSHLKRLIAFEQEDLRAGDIPMFTSRIETRDIYTSWGECIPAYLETSSMELVRRRFALFDEQDLKKQCWFIKASLATLLLDRGHRGYRRSDLKPSHTQVTHARLLQVASQIGDCLCERALVSDYGANWIGLAYVNEREWMLMPAGADLYAGTPGIAFFLAYLGTITGELKYTNCARAALTTVRELVSEMKKTAACVGGFNGWGSILYLYAHLGMLWHEPALLAEAKEIIPYMVAALNGDELYDMVTGAAGGISTLLSLYSVIPAPDTLAAAIQCGDWLITHAVQCMNTDQVENSARQRALTGFSHGAAGMALSLLRLSEVSNESRFRSAALLAMEYERAVFSPEQQNWPDFRVDDEQVTEKQKGDDAEEKYMVTWCHGAPGIALGRLNSLSTIDDAAIREEIRIALQTTIKAGFGSNHSLCHGDLGNLEAILSASLLLEDPANQIQLERLTSMILDSLEHQGWLTGVPLSIESPGLMTGIAGIGYEILRLAAPRQIPSVLVLEQPGAVPPASPV